MSRIGIVYPRANIDTVPSLVAAVEQLAEAGHQVEVFTYTLAGEPTPAFRADIRVHSLGVEGLADRSTAGLRRAIQRVGWLPDVARGPLSAGYRALGAGLAHGSRVAARVRTAVSERQEPFAFVIGVDPEGLVLARSMAPGASLGYFSLELLLTDEIQHASERELKARERRLSREAALIVIQDEARAKLLVADNGLESSRVMLVPNAPLGPARRKPSRFWHNRFDLPDEARVVLHSGSLGDWTGIEGIVRSVVEWPEPWGLVVHTRYDAESSAYVDSLRAVADPRRVRFSLKPVPRHDYDALIDGADVGLAFYVPVPGSSFTGVNVQTIGLSSGKLAYYVRAGLPVIVNTATTAADLVATAGCGLGVDDARGIAAALGSIAADHDFHSARALAFFDRLLDPRLALRDLVARIGGLSA